MVSSKYFIVDEMQRISDRASNNPVRAGRTHLYFPRFGKNIFGTGKYSAYSKIFRFKGDIFVSICRAGNIRILVPRTNKNAMFLQPFPSLFRPICSYSRFESITDQYQRCRRKFYVASVISFARMYDEKWKRPR